MADTMNLQEILRIEESISDLLETARNDIVQEIDRTEIEGVQRINDFCAVIKLSKLRNNICRTFRHLMLRLLLSELKRHLHLLKRWKI